MYRIRWRRRGHFINTRSWSVFHTLRLAYVQIAKWRAEFPDNIYYVEKV